MTKLNDAEVLDALAKINHAAQSDAGPTLDRQAIVESLQALIRGMVQLPLEALTAQDLPRGIRAQHICWLRETYGLSLAETARVLDRIKAARIKEIEDHIRSE